MKIVTRILIALAAIASLFAFGTYYYLFKAGDNQALEELLPNDTLAYADIKHIRKLGVKAATSDLTKTYEETMKIFVGAIAAASAEGIEGDSPFEDQFPELSGEDLLKLGIYFNRQLSVALISRPNADEEKLTVPSLIFLAHFQGKEKGFNQELIAITEKVNEKLEAEAKLSWVQDDWNGNAIHILNAPSLNSETEEENPLFETPEIHFCWTLIGTKFFASADTESLKSFIEKSSTLAIEDSLANHPKYMELDQLPLEADVSIFMNAHIFMPDLISLAEKEMQKSENSQQFGISLEATLKDIGLLSIDSIYSVLDFTPKEERFASGLNLSSKSGFWNLMKGNENGLSSNKMAPADIYNSAAYSLDLGELILWVKNLTLKNAPITAKSYPQFKGQIDQFIGMDIEEFFDRSFTKDIQIHTDIKATDFDLGNGNAFKIPSSSLVLAQELDDAELFESKIEEMLQPLEAGKLVPIEKKEIAGISYRKLDLAKMAAGGGPSIQEMSYCLAITHNKLILGYGTEALFTQSIELLQSEGPNAFDEKKTASALKSMPNDEIGYQFVDFQKLFIVLADVMTAQISLQQNSSPEVSEALSKIDWNALAQIQIKMVSKTYENEDGFHNIGRLVDQD